MEYYFEYLIITKYDMRV